MANHVYLYVEHWYTLSDSGIVQETKPVHSIYRDYPQSAYIQQTIRVDCELNIHLLYHELWRVSAKVYVWLV